MLTFLSIFFMRDLAQVVYNSKMYKDFDNWNNKKKRVHTHHTSALCHERELWWCSIGINVGHEEDGKGAAFARPVIIFKKFNKEMFWGIPVTTRLKSGKYDVSVSVGDNRERQAKISQLRLFDTRRLSSKIGMISASDYFFIGKAVTDVSTS